MNAPMEISALDLAGRLGGKLTGEGQRVLRAVATLEEAGPDTLSWLRGNESPKRLEHCRAGAILVTPECEVPDTCTVIRVPDPDLALCDALRLLCPPPEQVPAGVHSSAVVAADAQVAGAAIGPHVSVGAGAVVGAGTQLHAGVHIGAETRIGRDCVLWHNVVVRERTIIGDRVIIHPNATLGADGFGYLPRNGRHVKVPQVGALVIEDDVEIGACTCIDRAKTGVTRIGRGTKIDNLVQIGHNVRVGEHCVLVSQTGIAGSATLGHHVMLAGQVGVTEHVQIGDCARVAAKSGASRDVPAGTVFRGNPATDNGAFSRQQVIVRRLPALAQQVRELVRRVEQLESAANDRT